MTFDALTTDQLASLGTMFLGFLVGKGLGMESRVLSALIVCALLAPSDFALMGMGAILLSVIAKGLSQWVTWL